MDFHTFSKQYKKQTIIGIVIVLILTMGISLYFVLFHPKQTGTLLDLSPEEIARRLREGGDSLVPMTEEERIRSNPIAYVETQLTHYYALGNALKTEDWEMASTATQSLKRGLDIWHSVALSEPQKEQIDQYRKAASSMELAVQNNNIQDANTAYTQLRYLETMVLEARKSTL